MSLKQQIDKDLVQALKNKESLTVLVLRQIKTAISNTEISNNREELTDEGLVKVLKTEVKKRKDATELYKQGGREELAKQEQAEIEVLRGYLPPEMSEEDVADAVKAVIGETGATGPKDMGKVMSGVMAKLQGQADGSVVSKIVKEQLS